MLIDAQFQFRSNFLLNQVNLNKELKNLEFFRMKLKEFLLD